MSFIKHKFLQYLCIFFIGYSMLGGLLLPLSPNMESVQYTQTDSTLVFEIAIPKLKEHVREFYLEKTDIKGHSLYLLASHIEKKGSIYQVVFEHPKMYRDFEKGQVLDLMCRSKENGDLHYFSAFYIDSVIGDKSFSQTTLVPNPAKFHLSFPNRNILRESIRNLFFHVPMWFTMIGLLIFSLIQSILYLSNGQIIHDTKAAMSARVAIIFGTLGILTGMIWAKYTWGAFWTNDPKLNGAAIGMLAYLAYFILRSSVEDEIKKSKLAAVYNIFSFTIYMVFIMILPRINDSLHPGNGGNPGFNVYEQDDVMRLFFYPAVIGWTMLGFWITELYVKIYQKK